MFKNQKSIVRIASFLVAVLQKVKPGQTRGITIASALAFVLVISGCVDPGPDADPDEEGGIVGSGIIIRGTVNTSTFASNEVVNVKSSDGLVAEFAIDSVNQFNTTRLPGTGPWVLRVQPSADLTVYGIAYSDGTRNINRFSDLGLRRWFARQLLDINTEFDSPDAFTELPDTTAYAESVSTVFQLIKPVLDSYNVSGEEIISAEYVPNNQGLDAFLKRNTVLIENRRVSFLITDPEENTQSITQSPLTLDSDFVDNGTVAPTNPLGLRALGSDTDEIVLVWEPSSDDVAVHEYEISRNGVLIANTPFPGYTDSGLSQDTTYSYQIVAIDSAGNRSDQSDPDGVQPTQAFTLMNPDFISPPAPTLLTELSSTHSRVQFYWVVPGSIADVISFNVYRGIDQDVSDEILFSVTSTLATDTSVEENTTYCYRVSAVDASGNESALSDILCIDTIDSGSSDESTNDPLVDWNIPDIESFECDELGDRVIQGTIVISSGCFRLPETVVIAPGSTLRLFEGTVLKFGEAAKLIVSQNGTLTVNGTAEEPVVLTGEASVPGYWGGIEFEGSTSADNSIRGAVIQYAGGGDALAAIAITEDASRFRIEDTLVRNNQKMAMHFMFNNNIIDEFRGNRFTANESIGQIEVSLLESLKGNSDLSGNENDELDVPRNQISGTQITIPNLGIPLRWNGISISSGALTIEPGAEFRMVSDSQVNVDGTFTAIGTADNPIKMQGESDTTLPNWAGLLLTGRGDKTLTHVELVDAGGPFVNSGAIEFDCTTGEASSLNIDNTDISLSASWGIFIGDESCNRDIGENVTFFNNTLGDINIPINVQ